MLIGQGISYLPYFLVAFQELGRVGIGKPHGRYVVQRISAIHPLTQSEELVFDGVDVRVGRDLSITGSTITEWATQLVHHQIKFKFLSPTRIKYQGQYIQQPAFHVLVRALLRRTSALLAFHCGIIWNIDARGLIEQAEQITTSYAQVEWLEWDRYSGRQEQRIPLGGFVGQMHYQGNLAPFHTLIALGSLIHVGKATVFGHGRFQING